MMTSFQPPPIPADADLRDFAFMPIEISRLFGSAFHARANDAEWRGGFTLWLKSWHQVPAGSLPKDDIELCRLAELGRDGKTWKRIKAMALHGWAEHADGRLYHGVVTPKASEAWKRKLDQRTRTLKARIAALEKRLVDASKPDERSHLQTLLEGLRLSLSQTIAKSVTDHQKPLSQTSVTATKGEGEGEGEGEGDSRSSSEPNGSGAKAPAGSDFTGKLFTQGVDWLQSVTKKSNARCRALIGKWRKSVGDAVLIELVAEAQRQDIQSPEAWFTAAIKAREQAGTAGLMPKTADEAMQQFQADPAWRGVAA